MPTLVNYSGDDDFYSGGLYSLGSHVDLYCPPRKRARISLAPFTHESNQPEKSPSIDILPDECLFEILRRVQGGRERISTACVSKRWLMLMSSIRRTEMASKLEKSLDVEMVDCEGKTEDGYLTRSLEGKKATDVRLAAISVGTSGRGGLGKLSIRGSNSICGVTDLGLSAISRGCPSLKALSLWNVPLVGDEGLTEIAEGCPLLEKLDLCHCPSISSKGLIAIAENCPNLTALNVESCSRIGNEGLQAIGKLSSKLQSLSIRDCPLIGDHGVSSLLASASSSLSKLKLQSLNITDFSMAVIGHYGKAVTNLTLASLQNASEKGFWVMGNARGLEKLTSLTITSCRGVTDLSLESIGQGCANLKQMCLRKCCFVSDKGLVGFARAAASLESLQLEECNRVTQAGIVGAISNSGTKLKSLTLVKCLGIKDIIPCGVSIPSPCRSLRSLSIRSCPGFGSAGLAMIGKLCPQLHHIDLSGLYGITDTGILQLLESSKEGLINLNLSGCLNLTDEVVISLAKSHGSTLESLNLDGCRKITDVSLESLAENCLLLGDLDLSRCSITDAGISALSGSKRINLQVLSLSGCSEITNKSVSDLRKLGETLIGLNLQHCNSISSSTVELLVESLWRCDILF